MCDDSDGDDNNDTEDCVTMMKHDEGETESMWQFFA
jgi:hypothetical protein